MSVDGTAGAELQSCRSEEGITVGLVDAVIGILRVLAPRDLTTPAVQEALTDLVEDSDFRTVRDAGQAAQRFLQMQKGGAMSDQTEQRHTCPRRHENGMANPDSPFVGSGTNQDTWTSGPGLIGQGAAGLSCSYCGSLHPDRFMELVREGWEVGPTDKSYKAYLRQPLTAEAEAQQKAAWIDRDAVAKAVRELGERDGKTPEQIAADLDEQWEKIPHSSPGPEAKFYYQHLSPGQQDEFIELHNARRMRIGYPGRLYVLPFFAGPATA